MKDAMDTYFEEKKEREKQRQIERLRGEEKRKRKKHDNIKILFIYFSVYFFIWSGFEVANLFLKNFSELSGLPRYALLLNGNMQKYFIPGSGFLLFCYVLRIPVGFFTLKTMFKEKYSPIFFILLWIQLFSLLAECFHLSKDQPTLLIMLLAHVVFMFYFYLNKKHLFPTEKQTEEEGQP